MDTRVSRTRWVVACVVAIAVVAVTWAALANGHRDPLASTRPPRPPAGTKWVGAGRTVFAVPAGWAVWPELYCGSPDALNLVTILRKGVVVSCAAQRMPDLHHGTVLELRVDENGAVTSSATRAARITLPRGWLAVPRGLRSDGAGYPTVRDQERALTDAGFRVRVMRVPAWGSDGPPVTTDPDTGTPARVGSTVEVQWHVAALARSGLRGTLTWTGGPAPGVVQPRVGTVRIRGNGFDDYVAAGADGHWRISLPPGRYILTGTSPGFLSKSGAIDACHGLGTAVVRRNRVTVANVYCDML